MRIPRWTSPGVVYHVISRFVDRSWFFRDDADRALYLHHLSRALERSDWSCLAYALMSNHIHLAMVAGERPIGVLLKRAHSPFARLMNQRSERLGPLMAERPATWAIRPAHVAPLIAYIHNNPVRGGAVSFARDSHWTSHRAYIARAPRPAWLAVEDGLRRCEHTTVTFDAFVNGNDDPGTRADLAAMRRAVHKRGALEVGTPEASPLVVPLIARRFARVRPDPRDVVDEASQILGIPAAVIGSRSAFTDACVARRVVVHSAIALGLTASEISAALGLTRQAGSYIAQHVLDDRMLQLVELVCARFTTLTPSPAKAAQPHG